MNTRLRSDSNLADQAGEDDDSMVHPMEPKSKTPFLRPLMVSLFDLPLLVCWHVEMY
jgi:hypothetical protein